MAMTLPELKAAVATLTADERLDLYAYLLHLERVNDPEHRREMAERIDRMDQGDRVSLDEFIRANLPAEEEARTTV